MSLEIINDKNVEIFDALVKGVREYNAEILGAEESQPLTVVARDDAGNLIAGVSGRTIYQCFLIDVVWVHKGYRGSGLGRKVMELAEKQAIQRGCHSAQVDTLSFQGPVFYGKLGFKVVGTVEDFPAGHERYFLQKHYV
ncbi:GNAT family N-acetyltransferase [Shewanella litorisediminis]|uniref:GNAT family N-acetyltransferase n=1 Tax=Shewanella litorisediminis TaxID=1173586 RepID=A0ABX7G839_9GAMM|nr:GNAT family N-acetyltransferase [Shewanella litorisediminis]MCL2919344.1 GNAT family N-acetyltransferase [Shewanella litorisediminis]QRH03490.1 GNAT family N-acetyltransferase [Shewanella litorisediminis]